MGMQRCEGTIHGAWSSVAHRSCCQLDEEGNKRRGGEEGMRNGAKGKAGRGVGYVCRRAQGMEAQDTGREWGPKERERVGKDRSSGM